MQNIKNELSQFGEVKTNILLSKLTTFKIGGLASFVVYVNDAKNIQPLVNYLNENDLKYFVLGGGSNMLAPDEGYDGVVIKIIDKTITQNKNILTAVAGASTVEVAQASIKAKLKGFEWGVGVPGTIGGAVRGNAGAMGSDMANSVLKVQVLRDSEVMDLTNVECEFNYRDSIFKRNKDIILSVSLILEPSLDSEGMKNALTNLNYRAKTQPKGYASTGCIFKNLDINEPAFAEAPAGRQLAISNEQKEKCKQNKALLLKNFSADDPRIQQFLKVGKISAGFLIQEAGLKGLKCGNAEISPTHGNFIVNLGGAKAHEVLSLIETIKEKVYSTFGFNLEEEIFILNH